MTQISSVTSYEDGDPCSPSHHNTKLNAVYSSLSNLNSALGYTINPTVAPYSVPTNGDDATSALQTLINANTQDVIIDGQGLTYVLSGNGIVFPGGSTRIRFRNFQFSITGDATAISGTGLVFDCSFEHIFITATGHTTTGKKLIDFSSFSLCSWRHIRTFGTAGKTIHWYGAGNGSGSGPYYNLFEQCYGGIGQYYLHADDLSTPSSGPNANTFLASRVQMNTSETAFKLGRYTQAWAFNNVIIETAAVGYDINGISNTVRGGWLESVTTCFAFGANAICNLLDGPYVSTTSVYHTGVGNYQFTNAIDSILNDLSDVALLATRKPTFFATQSTVTTPPFAFSSETSLGFYRSQASSINQSYGTFYTQGFGFSSETSLGWYRSGSSAIALSYGTLNLNAGRLSSVRTIGSLASTGNVNDNEWTVTVGVSAATLAIRSGATTYLWTSSATTTV